MSDQTLDVDVRVTRQVRPKDEFYFVQMKAITWLMAVSITIFIILVMVCYFIDNNSKVEDKVMIGLGTTTAFVGLYAILLVCAKYYLLFSVGYVQGRA